MIYFLVQEQDPSAGNIGVVSIESREDMATFKAKLQKAIESHFDEGVELLVVPDLATYQFRPLEMKVSLSENDITIFIEETWVY